MVELWNMYKKGKLESLVAAGQLSSREIDVVMVAAGFLSYAVMDDYLCQEKARKEGFLQAPPKSLPLRTVQEIAEEITNRICGCQYQDGGSTELISADNRQIHLRVQGACVYCPQIRYTMDILKRAILFRAPEVEQIVIDGTKFEEKNELPINRQYTMSMFMKETGISYADLDRALERVGQLTDDDLLKLAVLKQIQTGSAVR